MDVVAIIALLCVFGMPTALVAMVMRQRYTLKMKQLELNVSSDRVRQLEATQVALDQRLKSLEAVVTSVDFELNSKLSRLSDRGSPAALPPRSSDPREK